MRTIHTHTHTHTTVHTSLSGSQSQMHTTRTKKQKTNRSTTEVMQESSDSMGKYSFTRARAFSPAYIDDVCKREYMHPQDKYMYPQDKYMYPHTHTSITTTTTTTETTHTVDRFSGNTTEHADVMSYLATLLRILEKLFQSCDVAFPLRRQRHVNCKKKTKESYEKNLPLGTPPTRMLTPIHERVR
jgi:hypothetical protein